MANNKNPNSDAEEKVDSAPNIVEQIPFCVFVQYLERMRKASKTKRKMEIFNDLKEKLTTRGATQFYPLLRLLLPSLELGVYGLKETKIADLYIKAIPLPATTRDALKLKHFKKPQFAGAQCGNFSECLFAVLERRAIRQSTKTIGEVNRDLDALKSSQNKIQWFQHAMQSYTALEQKYLVRIILKDLQIGVRHESCLKWIHTRALDKYNMTSSLLKVCEMMANPASASAEHGGGGGDGSGADGGCLIEIELFHPIKPMLASRVSFNKVRSTMSGPLGVEIKFDGERVMLHYRRGERIMLWSRNGIDLGQKYDYEGAFAPHIEDLFLCDSCILDGEMMSWDEGSASFVPFGSNRSVAQQKQQHAKTFASSHLCYLAFDILMLNDEITMQMWLSNRRLLLQKAFSEKKRFLEYTKLVPVTDVHDMVVALQNALLLRHEGIVIKALQSQYHCNKRGNDWVKQKPDYVDAIMGSLDLIILGGYFGQGRRRVGNYSHFLLGCKVETLQQNGAAAEDEDDADAVQFHAFCKVGTGYSLEELKQLQRHLDPHWRQFKRSELGTPRMRHLMPWKPQNDDEPDVWIEPRNSVIVELLCNEIVTCKSQKFSAGLTVRFPRCKRLRYDKAWSECATLKEIQQRHQSKGELHMRSAAEIAAGGADGDGEPPRKQRKKMVRAQPQIMDAYRAADVSNVEVVSRIFGDKEFCVLNAYDSTTTTTTNDKQQLEQLIVANGGIVTQNPMLQSTDYLIAERRTTKVQNIIDSETAMWNIMRPLWIVHSADKQRLMPLAPIYMLHCTRETRSFLKQSYDAYGDHYTRDTNVTELKEMMRKLPLPPVRDRDAAAYAAVLSDEEEMQLIGGLNKFKRCRVYVDYYRSVNVDGQPVSDMIASSSMRMIAAKLQIYGAQISQCLDPSVTHVVVHHQSKIRRQRLRSIYDAISDMQMNDPRFKHQPYVVTAQWVNDSLNKHSIVTDYHKYAP